MAANLSGKRIFIIEDNAGNLATVSIALQIAGAKTLIARRGRTAINRMREQLPIHLVLLDLMLDYDISGFSLFDEIRNYPEFTNIPIALVTAADPAGPMNQARQRGFAGFISKPIQLHIFSSQIASIIAGKPVWFAV